MKHFVDQALYSQYEAKNTDSYGFPWKTVNLPATTSLQKKKEKQ